jgi:hypothetical protein
VHKVGDVPKTPLGNAVLNATAFKNAFLTLKVKGNRDAIHHLPLNALNVPANDGKLKEFDLTDVDFENSYIQFSTAVGLIVDEEVLFSFYYDEK